MNKKKKLIIIIALITVFFFICFFSINYYIISSTKSYIYHDLNDIPKSDVAIILGARVYQNGRLSQIFEDRVLKGIELYNNQKVDKLLISGDHGRNSYDEVNTAKQYVLDLGIDPQDIFLDHAGFDTYDSLYRADYIFDVQNAIVITQDFHLPRSVYIARKMGINAYGFSADRHKYIDDLRNNIRESLARIKAFSEVFLNIKPIYLGDKIPIKGDGRLSWD